ncbi:MAG TPA: phosphodiester glycosidase family protein, partial [Longimicrobiales bacterium]
PAAAEGMAAHAADLARADSAAGGRHAEAFAGLSPDTLRVSVLAPGVRHAYAWLPAGPWAVHVLEIDGELCAPRIEVRKPGPGVGGRARTSELAADALAAVNADFFAAGGVPVGAHVQRGEVVLGPVARPVFAVPAMGADAARSAAASSPAPWLGRAALRGFLIRGADTVRIAQVNRERAASGRDAGVAGGDAAARAYTAWFGAASPPDSGAVAVRLSRTRGGLMDATGVVTALDRAGGGLPLDTGVVVVVGRGASARVLGTLAVGDTVAWSIALVPAAGGGAPAREAVGGQPVLLRGGRVAPDIREGIAPSFGERRHPRTAVGIAPRGRLLWVTVDGRQAPYSDGMSLEELADLMARLGAHDAINLDGGGSTTMVVRGAVVNRPSDAAGERPVGNALTLVECAARLSRP